MRAVEKRLEKLEQAKQPRMVMIVQNSRNEASEASIACHLAEHPEDAGCSYIIVDTGIERHTAG